MALVCRGQLSAKFLNDARRTTALAERRAEQKGCGSLGDVSVRANEGRKLKPTIAATSNLRLQRDEPDPERGHVTTHDYNSNTTNKRPTSSSQPTHHPFTPPFHITHSHHLFTQYVHTIHSHHPFTLSIHTTYSQQLFTAPIHSTYSHHIFTPDVHTGATDRDELPFHRRGGQDGARPPWFDRPEADATREVWWENGNGGQRVSTGSRGNGARVAEHE